MEQEGIFKTTTFGGFDKKSVLTYIDALTEKHHAEEEELRGQIDEFSKAQDSQVEYIQKLESQLTEMEEKLEAVAGQLEEERAATPQAASQINDLNQHNKDLEQKLEETERELKIQMERNRQLQFKAEGAVYKSQKYDELSAQVGDAMLVAKTNADKIVTEAQKQADAILREARTEAERVTGEAETQAREAVEQAAREAAHTLGQAESKAAEVTEQAEARATAVTEQARGELRRFGTQISSFQGDTARLRKSIEEILFVLNDRVDVMQEIVRQMDARAMEFSAEKPAEREGVPFEKAEDEAGYFGSVVPDAKD